MKERGSHVEMEPKKSGTGREAELKPAQTGSKIVRVQICWAFYMNLTVNETPQLHNMEN